MMGALVLKETRALLRDGRLWMLGGALFLLFVAMLATAQSGLRQAGQERREVEVVSRSQ